jgi:hypothetical protein
MFHVLGHTIIEFGTLSFVLCAKSRYGLNIKRRLNTRQTVGCGIPSSLLALRVDLQLEMMKLSEEGMSKAEIGRKLVSSHQHRGKTLHQQKVYDSLKAQMMVSIFQQ